MDIYKSGEGKLTRRVAFYSLLFLSVWGFKVFATFLTRWKWAQTSFVELELPYYEQPLNVAVLICVVLNIAVAWFLFKWLNSEKSASLLIDTETELNKVSWPTMEDARHSTVIVLIFVAACAAYLTAVEYALANLFGAIL